MMFKEGVDLKGVQPETVIGMCLADGVFAAVNITFVVTSVCDSKHMVGSLHYTGFAFDCRLPSTYTLSDGVNERVVKLLKAGLGAQWDVVLEKDHIHVEFDPD